LDGLPGGGCGTVGVVIGKDLLSDFACVKEVLRMSQKSACSLPKFSLDFIFVE